jgi:hypothetical protein
MSDRISLGQIQEASLATISLARDEVQALFAPYSEFPSDVAQTLRLVWYLSKEAKRLPFW